MERCCNGDGRHVPSECAVALNLGARSAGGRVDSLVLLATVVLLGMEFVKRQEGLAMNALKVRPWSMEWNEHVVASSRPLVSFAGSVAPKRPM